jgi:hypothetical protein
MTAFISGDPVMLQEIADNTDIHVRTASALMGFEIKDELALLRWTHSDYGKRILCNAPDVDLRTAARSWYAEHPNDEWVFAKKGVFGWLRQEMGKSQNYAENYWGMPPTIQATCRVKAGIEVGIDRVWAWYNETQARYARRAQWRQEVLDRVVRDGAHHLPIIGASRSFGDNEEAIRGLYRGEAIDFIMQLPSNCLIVSTAIESWKAFQVRKMQSVVTLNVHDALVADSPTVEVGEAQKIVEEKLRTNWFLRELEAHVGRTLPMGFERGVIGE